MKIDKNFNKKKLKSSLLGILLVLVSFAGLSYISGSAYAATSNTQTGPSYYNYTGYAGNSGFYMSSPMKVFKLETV